MKIKITFLMSRIYNASFKNRINEFLFLMALSFLLRFFVTFAGLTPVPLLFFAFISSLLSITTVRGSNAVIYSLLTHHVSMNLLDSRRYHSLHYYDDKPEICNLFKEEFVEGLLRLHKIPLCREIKLSTHKWVYDNIISDSRISSLYDINVSVEGNCRIPQEVLLLCPYDFAVTEEKIKEDSFKLRPKYSIKLTRKKMKS